MKPNILAFGNVQVPKDLNVILDGNHLSLEDTEAFIIDLVRSGEAGILKSLPPTIKEAISRRSANLNKALGESGTASTVEVLFRFSSIGSIYLAAIRASNTDLLNWFVDVKEAFGEYDQSVNITREFLQSDSAEMHDIGRRWYEGIQDELKRYDHDWQKRLNQLIMSEYMINATADKSSREDFLVSLWDSVWPDISQTKITAALKNVAKTTCSLRLGQVLIQHGAKVNEVVKGRASALEYATRKSTVNNAEFIKFLLYHGADAEKTSTSVKISDQIGAKELFRWLKVSWDELVEQARDHVNANASTS